MKKYRTGISSLVLNDKNEILLINLQSFEDRYYAIPGGGLEPSESLENAAYRELEEELGIQRKFLVLTNKSDEPIRFLFKTKKLNRDGVQFDGSERYFFGFRFTGKDSDISPDNKEIRTYKWVPYTDLEDHLLFENQLEETRSKILEIFPLFK